MQLEMKFGGFRDSAFAENCDAPLHRWAPWIAGFSASFVDDVFDKLPDMGGRATVLDPFAGVGTTLIEAMKRGHRAIGFEINPYAALACRCKVSVLSYDAALLRARAAALGPYLSVPGDGSHEPKSRPPAAFASRVPFFSPQVERQVLHCLDFIADEEVAWVRDLCRVALGAVMVGFSNYTYEPSLGTRAAAGKRNVATADVAVVLQAKLEQMANDIEHFQAILRQLPRAPQVEVFARSFFEASDELEPESADVLITSPPYLNNYHYVRNTRPQMFWLSMVSQPADLKDMETKSFGQFWQTVRSGRPIPLVPQIEELANLIEGLRSRNPDRGCYGGAGWANYAARYFNDCARFCRQARRLLKPGATAVVVIGNNILQGIEFKTDRFFARIAEQAGFEVVELHEVRKKRTGSSIVNSSVRVGRARERVQLYETAVELRAAATVHLPPE